MCVSGDMAKMSRGRARKFSKLHCTLSDFHLPHMPLDSSGRVEFLCPEGGIVGLKFYFIMLFCLVHSMSEELTLLLMTIAMPFHMALNICNEVKHLLAVLPIRISKNTNDIKKK